MPEPSTLAVFGLLSVALGWDTLRRRNQER
ncbi:PEP-CTERM sorting domain-containing protein [Singulisphaera rosea]